MNILANYYHQPWQVLLGIYLFCGIPLWVLAYHRWNKAKNYRAHQRLMRQLRGKDHPLNNLSAPAMRAIDRATNKENNK